MEDLPIEYKNLLMDPSNCCEKTYDKPVKNEPIQEDAIPEEEVNNAT